MSFPETPCDVCPRVARGLSLPCRAQNPVVPRYCELVRAGRQDYIEQLCGHVEPIPEPLVTTTTTNGAGSHLIGHGTRPLAETQALQSRMRGCAFWKRCDTGCGANYCSAGKFGGRPVPGECFACLEGPGAPDRPPL